MSDYDRNATASGLPATGAIAIDAGLRDDMLRVYNYMASGVGRPAGRAFDLSVHRAAELLQSPLMWVLMLAPLGLVFFISARINTLSVESGARLVLPLCGLGRNCHVDHFPHLHAVLDHAGVLYLGGGLRRAQHLGHTTQRSCRD